MYGLCCNIRYIILLNSFHRHYIYMDNRHCVFSSALQDTSLLHSYHMPGKYDQLRAMYRRVASLVAQVMMHDQL